MPQQYKYKYKHYLYTLIPLLTRAGIYGRVAWINTKTRSYYGDHVVISAGGLTVPGEIRPAAVQKADFTYKYMCARASPRSGAWDIIIRRAELGRQKSRRRRRPCGDFSMSNVQCDPVPHRPLVVPSSNYDLYAP